MKKNSGQVLIIFIIMIPILVSFIAFIGEAGYLYTQKAKITNVTKEAINYALTSDKPNVESEITGYIKANISSYDELNIDTNDTSIRVVLIKNQKSIFTNLIKEFHYTIKIDLVGTVENNKIIIKE